MREFDGQSTRRGGEREGKRIQYFYVKQPYRIEFSETDVRSDSPSVEKAGRATQDFPCKKNALPAVCCVETGHRAP